MAQNFLLNLKVTLDNCINELNEIHSMFCKNPESDFTRNRKLSFKEYIQLMIQMQSKSISNELLDFFEHSLATPSKSAFTQQRYKLQPEGWEFLFHSFVDQCRTLSDNLYKGYRLLACDGSDVNISRDPSDERTFIHEGELGYNAIHINALYDITNRTYCDFIETSFRELKYTIGLINWHSSKYEGILQELCARMILYNFCEQATAHAVVQTNKNTKHSYKINFATAVNICKAYLKHGGDENECMLLIQKHLTPVRHDRKYPIKLHPKRNRDSVYRVA